MLKPDGALRGARDTRAWGRRWLQWLTYGVTFGLVLGMVFRSLFQLYAIPSGSMSPTLKPGDIVVADRRIPSRDSVALRDAVVVFAAPVNQKVRFVKRIVGIPGDVLAMRDGQLWRNGASLTEPHAKWSDSAPVSLPIMAWQHAHTLSDAQALPDRPPITPSDVDWGPLQIPAGKYFVLGDNRSESSDSRYWGFVEERLLSGRLRLVVSIEPGRRLPVLRSASQAGER